MERTTADNYDYSKVTRLEIIGHQRELVRHNIRVRQALLQDDNRTLKIFIDYPEKLYTNSLPNQPIKLSNIYKDKLVSVVSNNLNEESLSYYRDNERFISQTVNKIDTDNEAIFELHDNEFDLYLTHQFYKHKELGKIKIIDYVEINHKEGNDDYIYVDFTILDFILNRMNEIHKLNYTQIKKIREQISYEFVDVDKIEHKPYNKTLSITKSYVIRHITIGDIFNSLDNN